LGPSLSLPAKRKREGRTKKATTADDAVENETGTGSLAGALLSSPSITLRDPLISHYQHKGGERRGGDEQGDGALET
jgi:hypothetical protein